MLLDSLVRTAVHEAGHAVVGTAFGHPVVQVSIQPGADYRGHTQFEWRGDYALKRVPLAATLAGDAAVEMAEHGAPAPARPRIVPWLWEALAERKVEEAPAAGVLSIDDAKHLTAARVSHEGHVAAWGQARAILRENWPAVHSLASALLEHGQLEGDDLARQLNSVRPASRDPRSSTGRVPGKRAPATTAPRSSLELAEVHTRRVRWRDVRGRVHERVAEDVRIYR